MATLIIENLFPKKIEKLKEENSHEMADLILKFTPMMRGLEDVRNVDDLKNKSLLIWAMSCAFEEM